MRHSQAERRSKRIGDTATGEGEDTTDNRGHSTRRPLSPLLANILLDDLDKELEKRGHRFVRYADDILILVRNTSTGRRVMQSITRFIEKKLKLHVNREKSAVRRLSQTRYLGFRIRGRQIWWSEASVEAFKNQICRRVRMCYWKQWKRRGTRIGKLLSFGVEYHPAIGQGKCRRGPWFASNMNGLRYALNNAWLEAQGLVSFQTRWVQLASIR
ncbi:MAG: hypothetical protein KJ626_16580 [Verrucomicrobia bacterium]|nr:hypothetical protein [Verrucomicrobiota bacterium]